MRIGQTLGVSSSSPFARAGSSRRVTPVETASESRREPERETTRALVALEPVPVRDEPVRLVRPRVEAPFLAQLIAAHRDLPEQRRLRRAEPGVATAIYARAQRGEGLLVPGYLVDVRR